MAIRTVAIFAPGEMGHAIGRVLVGGGLRVTTNLTDRSQRTRELAAGAGIVDARDDVEAIERAELVLSILPPDQAVDMATRLASALAAVADPPPFLALNPVPPATAAR